MKMTFTKSLGQTMLMLSVVFLGVKTLADSVTSEDVRYAARGWSIRNASAFGELGNIVDVIAEYDPVDSSILWYVVKLEHGAAIVSPDTEIEPIIAVLPDSDGDIPPRSPLRAMLLRDLRQRKMMVGVSGTATKSAVNAVTSTTSSKWLRLVERGKNVKHLGPDGNPATIVKWLDGWNRKNTEASGQTLRFWNQDYSPKYFTNTKVFNYCTPDNDPCGCVAAAGSAVLHYFRIASGNAVTRECMVDGKSKYYTTTGGPYDWSLIDAVNLTYGSPVTLSAEVCRDLLGRVASDVGIGCGMSYTASQSGSASYKLGVSFRTVFNFQNAQLVTVDAENSGPNDGTCISTNYYPEIIYNQIRAGAPVVLGIDSHEVVASGFGIDSDGQNYTYVFLGWGGSNDAWYALPEVNTKSTVEGGWYVSKFIDEIITEIAPSDNNYIPIVGRVTDAKGVGLSGESILLSNGKRVTTDGNGYWGTRVAPTAGYVIAESRNIRHDYTVGSAAQETTTSAKRAAVLARDIPKEINIVFEDGGTTPTIPAAPTVEISKTSLLIRTMSWNAVPGAKYYKVYRSTNPFADPEAVSGWQTERTFRVEKPSAEGTCYFYFVKAASEQDDATAGPFNKVKVVTGDSAYTYLQYSTNRNYVAYDDDTEFHLYGSSAVSDTPYKNQIVASGMTPWRIWMTGISSDKMITATINGVAISAEPTFSNFMSRCTLNISAPENTTQSPRYCSFCSTAREKADGFDSDTYAKTWMFWPARPHYIYQAGVDAFSVDTPTSLEVGKGCSTNRVAITATPTTTAWTATTDSPDWITLYRTSSTGSGVLGYIVAENPNDEAREGHITLIGASTKKVLTVKQTGTKLLPDLYPYKPSGWSAPVVATTSSSSTTTPSSFSTSDTIYVRWAVGCRDQDVNAPFKTCLYVDGVLSKTYSTSELSAGKYTYNSPAYSLGKLSAGTHQIKIVTDKENAIRESNESNNEYVISIDVQQPVTLTSLTISGPSSVYSGSKTTYTCKAYYSDGATEMVSPSWSIYSGSSYASIDSETGVLTAKTVSSQQSVTMRATYGGVSKNETITIKPPIAMATAVDNTTLSFVTGSASPWFGQTTTTHDGVDALQSGDVENDEESWVQTSVTGAGEISFWWYVESEEKYDLLEFMIDGEIKASISGTTNVWAQKSFTVFGTGSHTLRWRYSKDEGASRGLDAGFIDQVVWTPAAVLPSVPTVSVSTWGTNTSNTSYIDVSWTGGDGATSFNLYRSTSMTRPSTPFATNVTSPYRDYKSASGLTPGDVYYYWVEAVNSAGSAYSSYDWGNILVSLSLGKSSVSCAASGGSGSVVVTANTSWSATVDVSWITFTTGSGSGNGTLSYTIVANTTASSRSGTIMVTAGLGTDYPLVKVIPVTQDGVEDESKWPDLSFATFSSWAQNGTCVYVSDVWSNDAVRVCEKGKVFGVNYGFANFGETIASGTVTNRVEILDEHMVVQKAVYDHRTIALAQNRGYANNFISTTQIKDLPVGPYTVRVTLDAYNAIRECDENDNTYSYKFAVSDPVPLNMALNNATLTFVTDEESGWFGTKGIGTDGVDAAQSTHLGHSSTNKMSTTVSGPGTFAFKWKVSSEKNQDRLQFLIDGSVKCEISGIDGGWESRSFDIPDGVHAVEWRYAKDKQYSVGGDCGWVDQVVWTSGVGGEFEIKDGVLTRYYGSSSHVMIPSGVQHIGEHVFYGHDEIESLTIPSNVKSIGNYAFDDCTGLTRLEIAEGVVAIGDSAFAYCDALTSVELPKTVTNIGDFAFQGCSRLQTLVLNEGLSAIGAWAFNGCSEIVSVTIPSTVDSIGKLAFAYCSSITNLTIKEGVRSLGEGMVFGYCTGLTSVVLPASIVDAGWATFSCCSSLVELTFNGLPPDDLLNSVLLNSVSPLIRYNKAYEAEWLIAFSNCGYSRYEAFLPETMPTVDGDEGATVTGDAETGFVVKPSEGKTAVEVTIPQGVDAAKVTVEVSVKVASVKPNGAKVKIVSGGADITEFLNVPVADGNGVIDLTRATVKEEIVKEVFDTAKGAVVELGGGALGTTGPVITTAPTKPGLVYTFREGTTLEELGTKAPSATKIGDDEKWSPKISVSGGKAAFYSIGVEK